MRHMFGSGDPTAVNNLPTVRERNTDLELDTTGSRVTKKTKK